MIFKATEYSPAHPSCDKLGMSISWEESIHDLIIIHHSCLFPDWSDTSLITTLEGVHFFLI